MEEEYHLKELIISLLGPSYMELLPSVLTILDINHSVFFIFVENSMEILEPGAFLLFVTLSKFFILFEMGSSTILTWYISYNHIIFHNYKMCLISAKHACSP